VNDQYQGIIEPVPQPAGHDTKPPKSGRAPREPKTYRGARRNAARGLVWMQSGYRFDIEVKEGWTPAAELNRSPNWSRARSYSYAREISPFPERPVR
jgi:hypothetical protein